MPIYSLDFSNVQYRSSLAPDGDALLLGLTSCKPKQNRVQILEMCEASCQITNLCEVQCDYPATKIQWIPRAVDPEKGDLFATSSDMMRIYTLGFEGQTTATLTLELHNNSEYCMPVTSFDWNKTDVKCLAASSIDTTVTIWDLEHQQVTTQLIAHDKAVYDICFAKESMRFGTCGEDGSVRVFDLRSLEQSTII